MDGAGGVEPLPTVGGTDSERLLEDTLDNHPELIDEDMQLVGRQIRTASGPLDLLGVDRNGQLVVFELKRARLQRDALAQIIDYASYLDNLGDRELFDLLTPSVKSPDAENFETWYASKFAGKDLSSLRPVQITLVGLGVDDTTNRMVRYLANGGMSISLLTFSGYNHNGQTLLARQVQVEALETVVENSQTVRRPKDNRSLQQQVLDRVEEHRESWKDGYALFHSVRDLFNHNLRRPSEIGSQMGHGAAPYQLVYRRRANVSDWYAIVSFVPGNGNVEIWFHGRVVERCLEQFIELEQVHLSSGFIQEPTLHQHHGGHGYWFGMKSPADLETHKDKLIAVTQAVRDAYEQAAQETGYGMDENGGG